MPSSDHIDALFSPPSLSPSRLSPIRLPGITHESESTLVRTLKDNHVRWHAYFNDKGFHNHTSHHLLAIYAMGASAPVIEEAYARRCTEMRPAFESPELITEGNFWDHLSDKSFYDSYLRFFIAKLLEHGAAATIEKYIFSSKANIETTGSNDFRPMMLNRFLAQLFHPMIHTGCGLEFGFLGLVAEGLAQSACHPTQPKTLFPASLFHTGQDSTSTILSRVTSLFLSLTLNKPKKASEAIIVQQAPIIKSTSGVHAFTILARILQDPRFSPSAIGLPVPDDGIESTFDRVEKTVGEALLDYVSKWDVDGSNAAEVEEKFEELVWMNTLIYGVGGWSGRQRSETGDFLSDFLLMHLVTSTLFIPSITAYLTPKSTSILLRSFFIASITWWISRGRPILPIRDFYAATSSLAPVPGTSSIIPAPNTLAPNDAMTPNPWLPIIQTTLVHPNEHLSKLQRALAHFATLYGAKPAGYFSAFNLAAEEDKEAVLDGMEVLDGTLFIRVARLTADSLGWMREGQEQLAWSYAGFFE